MGLAPFRKGTRRVLVYNYHEAREDVLYAYAHVPRAVRDVSGMGVLGMNVERKWQHCLLKAAAICTELIQEESQMCILRTSTHAGVSLHVCLF